MLSSAYSLLVTACGAGLDPGGLCRLEAVTPGHFIIQCCLILRLTTLQTTRTLRLHGRNPLVQVGAFY